jgi:CheY-like chemotaxis protein
MISTAASPSLAKRTILVVEDEVLIRMLISDVLRDAGLRVVEAANADEALMYVKSDHSVRFVFSDVRMPGSMDGIELAQRLRSEFPHIAVALASGHLIPSDVEKGTLLITKPYPLEETAARIIAILEARGSVE